MVFMQNYEKLNKTYFQTSQQVNLFFFTMNSLKMNYKLKKA